MKAILAIALLVGLAAVFFAIRGPQRSTLPAPRVDPADQALLRELTEDLGALQAELEGLRSEQSALALRLAELEARPAAVAAREPVGGPSSRTVEQALEMVAAIQDPSKAAAPGLETFVLDVLGEKEERERAEREERRLTALTDALQERVTELSAELGLSTYQAQELLGILSTEATRRDAVFEELRETGVWDRRTMRESMGKVREETLGSLQSVLTPEQLARYRELEERPPFFGDFGGGRGGRGRDGADGARPEGDRGPGGGR